MRRVWADLHGAAWQWQRRGNGWVLPVLTMNSGMHELTAVDTERRLREASAMMAKRVVFHAKRRPRRAVTS